MRAKSNIKQIKTGYKLLQDQNKKFQANQTPLYDASSIFDSVKEEIFIERLTDGKKTDTISLNSEVEKMAQNFEMMLPYIIEEPSQKIRFHHEFNQDTIKMYYSIFSNYRILHRLYIVLFRITFLRCEAIDYI